MAKRLSKDDKQTIFQVIEQSKMTRVEVANLMGWTVNANTGRCSRVDAIMSECKPATSGLDVIRAALGSNSVIETTKVPKAAKGAKPATRWKKAMEACRAAGVQQFNEEQKAMYQGYKGSAEGYRQFWIDLADMMGL